MPAPETSLTPATAPVSFKQLFRWNRASYVLLSLFFALVFLIILVWWPLAEEYLSTFDPRYPVWAQIDYLLIGIFLVMSLLIMGGADLKADTRIVAVGFVGGLVIESWGTQTNLWHYYTNERPPLWIIPAWPIASLAIDRLVRALGHFFPATQGADANAYRVIHWGLMVPFYALMLWFVWPTLDKSLTLIALVLCALLIVSAPDHRLTVLTFVAGAGLGYFLELWGTTRYCWIYYTRETPPLFAVLAHGMAAVAFWRTALLADKLFAKLVAKLWPRRAATRQTQPARTETVPTQTVQAQTD